MTRKDDEGDQPSGGETTWTNTGATRYGRGQHKTGSFGDDMLRPSPNHGTQRLPNDDDEHLLFVLCAVIFPARNSARLFRWFTSKLIVSRIWTDKRREWWV